jgi:anti-sigma28 factor (negative regulator of flagellin synthesis)
MHLARQAMEEARIKVHELKEQLTSGAYRVDAQAVADALMHSALLATLLRPSETAACGSDGR